MIATGKLVGKQHADVKYPGGDADVRLGCSRCDLIVDPENGEDLESGNAMDSDQEDGSKGQVEADAFM